MNLQAIRAFWTVSQWQFRKPLCLLWENWRELTPTEIVAEINRTHAEAAKWKPSWRCRVRWYPWTAHFCGCERCRVSNIHRKVTALWKMEALGVRLGMLLPEMANGNDLNPFAAPIVIVGLGAGAVAKLGFDAAALMKLNPRPPYYFYDGVGHLASLQYHPLIRRLLAMPYRGVDEWAWFRQFSKEIQDRLNFGKDRMDYLCGEKRIGDNLPECPGAQFAASMMSMNPTGAARKFLEEVWPPSNPPDLIRI